MTQRAVMNTSEAAHYVGLAPMSFLRDVKAGLIPPALPSTTRRKRWSRAALDEWLAGRDKTSSDPVAEALNAAYPEIHSAR